MRLVFGIALGALIWAAAMTLIISTAKGHDWIEEGGYRNTTGTLCCAWTMGDNERRNHPPDCAPLPCEEAWVLGIGSVVNVVLPYGTVPTVINSAFASQDPNGRCMVCTTGCLFRISGS